MRIRPKKGAPFWGFSSRGSKYFFNLNFSFDCFSHQYIVAVALIYNCTYILNGGR